MLYNSTWWADVVNISRMVYGVLDALLTRAAVMTVPQKSLLMITAKLHFKDMIWQCRTNIKQRTHDKLIKKEVFIKGMCGNKLLLFNRTTCILPHYPLWQNKKARKTVSIREKIFLSTCKKTLYHGSCNPKLFP